MARGNQNIDLTRPIPTVKLVREFSRNQTGSQATSRRLSSVEPLVPGFGVEDELPPVPGFGTAGGFFSVRVIDRDRRTVDERFRRYDSNRDGYLSREELARNRWSDDPLVYDRNRDGRLSKEEMAVRYARRRINEEQRRRGSSRESSISNRSSRQQEEANRLMTFYVALDTNGNKMLEPDECANNRSRSTIERRIREVGMDPSRPVALSSFMSKRLRNAGVKSDQVKRIIKSLGPPRSKGSGTRQSEKSRRSYRFKTAHERLPSGVPAWFRERDLNRDGQVEMAEYSSSWTAARVAEFREFDLNRDGFITPKECMASRSKETVEQPR